MLSNGSLSFTYDSANRLVCADDHVYTYNAEDVRIGLHFGPYENTTYVYDVNCKLSKLLMRNTNGVVTKYVYGRGLIGEETVNGFKTYHFDARGSTIAITDANGNITDTFAYDTYGKLLSRTGTSSIIFGYNGRDGVVTDTNGLIYMRARYYLPEMKRFINADIIPGEISNAVTLNRFAYANGNPVSFVDPFGLSPDINQSFDSKLLFEILKNIKSKEDTALSSEMLAAVLDQLLNFRHILKVSQKMTVNMRISPNTTVTFSSSASSGYGNLEIEAVISEQLELAGSFSFPVGDNGSVSVHNDGSVYIECSSDIDEHTSISAAISANCKEMSISAGYSITTSDNQGNFISTSIEVTHKMRPLIPPKSQKKHQNNGLVSDDPIIDTVYDGAKQEDELIVSGNSNYGHVSVLADIDIVGLSLLFAVCYGVIKLCGFGEEVKTA